MVNNVQPSYQSRLDPARAGLMTDCNFQTKTGIVETEAGIGFGLAVSQGVNEQGVVLGGASKFLGVTVRDITQGAEEDKYPKGASLSYLKYGEIWVSPAADVANGDVVTYDSTTGRFSNTGGVAIPGARWSSSGAQDTFAKIELMANAGS